MEVYQNLNISRSLYLASIYQISDEYFKRFLSYHPDNFGCPHLTLKKGPKVKSDHTRRFPAHDFLYVGLPSQTSTTNNKRVISTFNFGYPRLTLKKGPRVNSVHTRRFPANDFLYAGLPSQTSRSNNKRVISNLTLAILF